MREVLLSIWNSIRDFWSKTSRRARVLILTGFICIFGVSLAIVLLLNHTDYVILYDNLTVTENAGVLAQLQEMGIEGKLEGTSLLIPKGQENTVRMQLAMKGYADSGFGTEIYDKGGGLTATQFDKEKYDIAQQQKRLESTIKTIPEVLDAHVTISIPESSVFVLQSEVEKPSVSVMIKKMPGRQLTADQVRGVLSLVRTAVPGLTDDNIAIVDEAGDMRGLLGIGGDKNSVKLLLTEQVNETFERRILSMLAPIYGDEKVAVRVNSVLDTDESVIDKITYIPLNPDDPTNNPLDYHEWEAERNAAGPVVQGVPGANDNTDVPQYAAEIIDDENGNYYRGHNILDYLVSSERNQIIKEGMTITDMTVAVLIDAVSLPTGQRDQILDLVATASGVLRDKVSVQNIEFSPRFLPDEPVEPDNWRLLLIIICTGLLMLAVILTIVFMSLSKRKKEKVAQVEDATLAELLAQQQEDFEPIQLVESPEQKLRSQIKELAISDPEIVAQLIKSWLLNV